MIDDSILEQGIMEFRKGLDRLKIAKDFYSEYEIKVLTVSRNAKNIVPEKQKDLENCADFLSRGIELLLKGLVYIYIPDADPVDINGHKQKPVINMLRTNYDIAPTLKELDAVLENLDSCAHLIHDFISSAAYEGCKVFESTLKRLFSYAEELEAFGNKYEIKNIDSFKRKNKEKEEEN